MNCDLSISVLFASSWIVLLSVNFTKKNDSLLTVGCSRIVAARLWKSNISAWSESTVTVITSNACVTNSIILSPTNLCHMALPSPSPWSWAETATSPSPQLRTRCLACPAPTFCFSCTRFGGCSRVRRSSLRRLDFVRASLGAQRAQRPGLPRTSQTERLRDDLHVPRVCFPLQEWPSDRRLTVSHNAVTACI